MSERVRSAFVDAYRFGCFLLPKRLYDQMLKTADEPEQGEAPDELRETPWFRKLQLGLSAPVSRKFASHMLYDPDSDEVRQLDEPDAEEIQILTLHAQLPNSFGAFDGRVYGYARKVLSGIATFNTDLLSIPQLKRAQLAQYLSRVDDLADYRDLQVLGAEIQVHRNEQAVDDQVLNALKVMWGQHSQGSANSSKVFNKFRFQVLFRPQHPRQFCQNFLQNSSASAFDPAIFPPTMRAQAARLFKDYLVFKYVSPDRGKRSERNLSICLKAVALELRYSDPGMLPYGNYNYFSRKQAVLTEFSQPTYSVSSALLYVAAIVIQSHARMRVVRKAYSMLPRQTSLFQKIKKVEGRVRESENL